MERFSVLVLGPERQDTGFGASMRSMTADEAATRPLVRWDAELLRTACPATGTLLSARDDWELDLALELHRRVADTGVRSDHVSEGSEPLVARLLQLFNSSAARSGSTARRRSSPWASSLPPTAACATSTAASLFHSSRARC